MLKKWISSLQLARDVWRRKLGLLLFDRNTNKFEINNPIKRVVLVRWDAKWGDSIVSSFIFREWRKTYPNIKIDVITTPNMAKLFKDHFNADQVYEMKKRPSYTELKKLALEIGSADILVHLSKALKMKDLYFMSKVQADVIAGLDDEVGLINLKLGELSARKHFSEKFKLLLEKTGVFVNSTSYIVPNDADAQVNVDIFITDIDKPILVLNPYGSGNSRQLTCERIKSIIDTIFNIRNDISIILLMTPDKKSKVLAICRDYENVFCDENTKSIYDSIAIMRHAEWVVSVDTATVHIAVGLGKPLLAIYNPDDENFLEWGPNQNNVISVFSENKADINDINLNNACNELKKLLETV